MKYVKVIVVLIIIAMFSCIFIGCDKEKEEEDKGLYSAANYGGAGNPSPVLFLEYRAETREFDIDNVQLEVSFGWLAFHELDKLDFDISDSLYALNAEDRSNRIVIRDIPRLNDIEYSCDFSANGSYLNSEIIYNHSEKIIIPSALFIGERGTIFVAIDGEIYPNHNLGGGYNSFKYTKIEGNRVKLSAK